VFQAKHRRPVYLQMACIREDMNSMDREAVLNANPAKGREGFTKSIANICLHQILALPTHTILTYRSSPPLDGSNQFCMTIIDRSTGCR
ncbi:hypothetical protein AVEN_84906-1, partial [Araneus ventricosus]